MTATIGICNSLTEFFLLSSTQIVEIDIIQQPFFKDLSQNLLLHSLSLG
jgi:hypothetical protein